MLEAVGWRGEGGQEEQGGAASTPAATGDALIVLNISLRASSNACGALDG